MASEDRVRCPLGRATRCGLLEHVVNLLEGQALCLGNQEVGKNNARSAGRAPDEEDLGLEVAVLSVDHVRCDEANDEVPEPVARCRQRDTLRANRQGKDLANDNPRHRTPGGGEEENVEAGEDDEAHGGSLAALGNGAHDGDDELADEHAHSSIDEEHAATELLNGPEGKRCGANVNSCDDHGNDKSVLETDSLEEGGTVIED